MAKGCLGITLVLTVLIGVCAVSGRWEASRRQAAIDEAAAKERARFDALTPEQQQAERAAKEAAAKAALEQAAARDAARKKELLKSYGKRLADLVIAGTITEQQAGLIKERKVWIGMTAELAVMSWGKPSDINRTTNANGTREQWVYGSSARNYLYFDNGILTSIQN